MATTLRSSTSSIFQSIMKSTMTLMKNQLHFCSLSASLDLYWWLWSFYATVAVAFVKKLRLRIILMTSFSANNWQLWMNTSRIAMRPYLPNKLCLCSPRTSIRQHPCNPRTTRQRPNNLSRTNNWFQRLVVLSCHYSLSSSKSNISERDRQCATQR